ncbi:MAG TPA: TIGR04282 family arsenosugar biosynthesis glycosyltransferase [Candidatus Eisenbacteria bacterium]|nr:TIGR04282 family arsenosugar biosynthesis glycosyltransferase [Candidatus Eisenbacteria bacterium]
MNDEHLIVFVKAPRPGTVKTRLAMAAEAQCAAYQRLVRSVLGKLTKFNGVELRFAPWDAEHEIHPWLRPDWSAAAQSEGDLGQRLAGAFADAFRGGAKGVVIIGSDCPYLDAEDIREAWAQLRTHDLVLGPAEDGGYWLIGLRQNEPGLFENITWSSATVFSETMARAKAFGLKSFLLRTLSDVDTREDWERFIAAEALSETQRQSPAAD